MRFLAIFGLTLLLPLTSALPHDPIHIQSELDLALGPVNGVVGGSGTSSDPYIISGWEIDLQNRLESAAISISGVTSYIEVHDISITNGANQAAFLFDGISISGQNIIAKDVAAGFVLKNSRATFEQVDISNSEIAYSTKPAVSWWQASTGSDQIFYGRDDSLLTLRNLSFTGADFGFLHDSNFEAHGAEFHLRESNSFKINGVRSSINMSNFTLDTLDDAGFSLGGSSEITLKDCEIDVSQTGHIFTFGGNFTATRCDFTGNTGIKANSIEVTGSRFHNMSLALSLHKTNSGILSWGNSYENNDNAIVASNAARFSSSDDRFIGNGVAISAPEGATILRPSFETGGNGSNEVIGVLAPGSSKASPTGSILLVLGAILLARRPHP